MIKMTELNQGFITHNLYINVAISHAYHTLTCDFQSSSYSFRKSGILSILGLLSHRLGNTERVNSTQI